jgi:NADH-quinone oxidoreductase subunit L
VLNLLFLVPLLPFAGFAVLAVGGRRLSRGGVAAVGAGSIGLAAIVALAVALAYWAAPPAGHHFTQVLWTWFSVAGLTVRVALYLDPLSVIFILVITGVGFLIHLYSTEHMAHDDGYARFFTYMNLFVGFMLLLVLADNLLLLYVGWEGVGACSYFLIGFWYRHWYNGYAARKAFVVTRVGDTALMVGLFLLFTQLHTLQIQPLMQRAAAAWPVGSGLAVAAAALLLGGALGKSAQLPLQTWLPDAMAGPSPVSALIHAATMVTAGVYLIARTNALFDLAPSVRLWVAIIGAATLLFAGVSALFQVDLKRILAYSTISQIGYMFLALGVGAWSAGIFMFWTHAFFKALLFLSAGVVIDAMDDEHDIFKMGGLRTRLPVAFWTFTIGAAALAALPIVTSGFYSKDLIVDRTIQSTQGSAWLWAVALAGALVTGLYAFRAVFVVFFGPARAEVRPGFSEGPRVDGPLYVLAALSIIGGLVNIPRGWGHLQKFEDFLAPVLPAAPLREGGLAGALWVTFLPAVVSLAGIGLAYLLYQRRRQEAPEAQMSAAARYFLAGWGFDRAYRYAFEVPFLWFARVSRDDLCEPPVAAVAWLTRAGWRALSATQTGLVRSYVYVIGVGVAVGVLLVVALR